MISDRLDAEIKALSGSDHRFQNFCFVLLNDIDWTFGVCCPACRINLGPIRCLPDIMDRFLPVFLSTEDLINPDQIPNSICKEPPPCFTVACRHSLLYRSSTLQWINCLPLQPNISNFQSKVPDVIFLHPCSYVFMHSWVTEPFFLIRGMTFWPQSSHEDHFWHKLSRQYLNRNGPCWFLLILSW